MTIEVRVKPSAKEERVTELAKNIYSVWVKEPAQGNRANFAVIKVLAEHFGKPIGSVRILKGQKNTHKTVVLQ